MRYLLLLLLISPAFGQSVIMSSGHRSIVMSSRSTKTVEKTVVTPRNVKVVERTKIVERAVDVPVDIEFRLQLWTAPWCGLCPSAHAEAKAAAAELGCVVELIDYDSYPDIRRQAKVTGPPTLCIVSQKGIHSRIVGVRRRDVVKAVRDLRKAWRVSERTKYKTAPSEASFRTATKSNISASSRSFKEMVELHNRLHGGGSWTWPGNLEQHLRQAHGVNTR